MADVIYAGTIYRALMNQAGTAAPVATILGDNTIGAIVWTRNSTGVYVGTLVGAFGQTRTWCVAQEVNRVTQEKIYFRSDSNDIVVLQTVEMSSGTFFDGLLVDTPILIIVF